MRAFAQVTNWTPKGVHFSLNEMSRGDFLSVDPSPPSWVLIGQKLK